METFKDLGSSACWAHVLYNNLRHFLRADGERPGESNAWFPKRVDVSLAITGKRRTCLVYHINEGLCIVSRKTTDHFILIMTREDRVDQGREFMQDELASDQTPTGCDV